jgi:hypothetical protein
MLNLRGPDKKRVVPEAHAVFTPERSDEYPEDLVGISFALGYQQIKLPEKGKYTFEIRIDGRKLGSVPLRVLEERTAENGIGKG